MNKLNNTMMMMMMKFVYTVCGGGWLWWWVLRDGRLWKKKNRACQIIFIEGGKKDIELEFSKKSKRGRFSFISCLK